MNRHSSAALVLTVFAIVCSASLQAQEWVQFEGMDELGGVLQLKGILTLPQGPEPFPAVVLLCECAGMKHPLFARWMQSWADRLSAWGYASLQVDSFGPRGYDSACGGEVRSVAQALDACAAKAFLAGMPFIAANRMGVIGWSTGGGAAMIVADALSRGGDTTQFQAAVAFYPYCLPSKRRDTPLLIMIGAKDREVSPVLCQSRSDGRLNNAEYELQLVIYPNASHSFNVEGLDTDFQGMHLEYDPEASADAAARTRDFLAKYLGTSK